MTMFKTKEQIEEMAEKEYPTIMWSNAMIACATRDKQDGYKKGYTQAQQDIKEACSEGFDDCFSKYATESNLHHEFDAHYFWQACALSKMKELQEKDEEIERMKKDNQSYYENNQKIIKSLELKEDKYQEAVKDIEKLSKALTDAFKNVEPEGCCNGNMCGCLGRPTNLEFYWNRLGEETLSKYGLDKEEN